MKNKNNITIFFSVNCKNRHFFKFKIFKIIFLFNALRVEYFEQKLLIVQYIDFLVTLLMLITNYLFSLVLQLFENNLTFINFLYFQANEGKGNFIFNVVYNSVINRIFPPIISCSRVLPAFLNRR